jgi:hypothetical protein
MAGKVSVELRNSERRVSDNLRAENDRLRADLDQMRGFRDGLAKTGAELGAENERLRAALKDMTQRVVASWERRDLAPDGDLEAVEAAEKLY